MAKMPQVAVSELQQHVGRVLLLLGALLGVRALGPGRAAQAQSDSRPTSIFDEKWLQNHPDASSLAPPAQTPPPPEPVAGTPSNRAPQAATRPIAAVAKVTPPGAAAVSGTEKAVREVFADDFSVADTPQLKAALAAKLLETGEQTHLDLTARYVLCQMARDLSCAIGDAAAALRGVEVIAQSFELDAWAMRMDTLAKAVRGSRSSEPSELVGVIATTMDQAVLQDRYDAAKQLGSLALDVSKVGTDLNLRRWILARITVVKEAEGLSVAAKAAEAVLARDPANAQANLNAGLYRCFVKADWVGGLPLLAKGGDAGLQTAAAKELANPTELLGELQIGDSWWELAGGMKDGLVKQVAQQHAAQWYKTIEPQLTELNKARVEKRLKQLEPHISAGADNQPRIVNLLQMIDPAKDALVGVWKNAAGRALESDGMPDDCLQIRYQPPSEYDFHIEFTRLAGIDGIQQIISAGGTQFCLSIGGGRQHLGFETVNGRNYWDGENKATVHFDLLNGRKYSATVKVRKWGVEAYIDGKLMISYKTDFSDLAGRWPIVKGTLGLGSYRSPTRFDVIEVLEITGQGKLLPQQP